MKHQTILSTTIKLVINLKKKKKFKFCLELCIHILYIMCGFDFFKNML